MTSTGLLSLPVAMYHYVCDWKNSIAVSTATFEDHLTAMTQAGFRGVSLQEAIAYMQRGAPLPTGSALLSFDDGYLDNYVYALPLLKRHGHKGVVFGVTERIDQAQTERSKLFPNLDDVESGRYQGPNPPQRGLFPLADEHERPGRFGGTERTDSFISWREARVMEDSGVLAVEAHSHRHLSVFSGAGYDGFYAPEERQRPFDGVMQRIVYGLPRFTLAPSLAARAFVPSDRLYDLVLSLVPQEPQEARAFLANKDNLKKLKSALNELARAQWGGLESPEDFRRRVKTELKECRSSLRRGLGRDSNVLAWPWGKYNQAALTIAKELGFEVFFAVSRGANERGVNYEHIHRFKAKDKPGAWLTARLQLYSTPWKAKLYAMFG